MKKDKLTRLKTLMMDRGGEPHVNPQAMVLLRSIINSNSRVLETGAGSSTVWFAERVKKIISFEHKRKWYEVVLCELLKLGKINYFLFFDPKYPVEGVGNADSRYDIIFIDGRGRVKSIMTSHKLLKKGGYLILDDSYRKKYKAGKDFLDNLGWEKTITYNIDNPPREAIFWKRT